MWREWWVSSLCVSALQRSAAKTAKTEATAPGMAIWSLLGLTYATSEWWCNSVERLINGILNLYFFWCLSKHMSKVFSDAHFLTDKMKSMVLTKKIHTQWLTDHFHDLSSHINGDSEAYIFYVTVLCSYLCSSTVYYHPKTYSLK